MRRLPGSTAYSILQVALLVGATSCGLRTTLEDQPGMPGQSETDPSTSTGKNDAGVPGAVASADAATQSPGKADASPATTTPPTITPDAAQPVAVTPDAAPFNRPDTRADSATRDISARPEVGFVLPPITRDASVGGPDVRPTNRDAGIPPTPPVRDGGSSFAGPDLGTRVPGVRDAGFAFPTAGIDAGFGRPFTIDGGITFGGRDAGRNRPDGGRGRGAPGLN